MATVTLDRLSKRYPGTPELAVDQVSLTVEDGEFMVLLGPSGCGKSTTLRMIAGLESISDGELAIDGVRMNETAAKDRDIAMVFQSYALYPHMSVEDNLAFGVRRRGAPKAEVARRVREVSTSLGLSELLTARPYQLSGGQRQRVALGRAIVRDPKVFLFDEPLSNLDAALRQSNAARACPAASAAGGHDGLCHSRSGGGHDAWRPDLRHGGRPRGPDRQADGRLSPSGQRRTPSLTLNPWSRS
jgi:multiple sugar transport system ATP-binding protein